MARAGGEVHSVYCIVHNAPSALNFPDYRGSSYDPEFRFAVLIDETVIATSSLASFSSGAAVC